MSNDISTMYTKDKHKKVGRMKKSYDMWKREKEVSIRPCDYGNYVLQKHKRKG